MLPTLFGCFKAAYAQVGPQDRVLINFLLPINSDTVNSLLRIVNDQAKKGITNITLLMSSPGGDTPAALAAYNVLRSLPIELTTFNIGNVDSAAVMVYCAGRNRFSLPGPGTRFLIHGNRLTFGVGVPLDALGVDSQLQQLKSLNQMVIQVLSSIAPSKRGDIENAVQLQRILTPEQAKEWGIVQEIRTGFMEPGATLIAVAAEPKTAPIDPWHYTSITPP